MKQILLFFVFILFVIGSYVITENGIEFMLHFMVLFLFVISLNTIKNDNSK